MAAIRALLFYIGAGVAAVLVAPIAILLMVLPMRTRYQFTVLWNRFAISWLAITCGVRHRVTGMEHVPDDGKPLIIFCKHQSAFETIAMPPMFPPQVLVFKRELLWIPFFGWGLATLQPIVLDRSARHHALRTLITQGKERLGRGLWITLFPEGTRVAPGTKGRYNAGGALLAAETGTRVLPIAHNAGVFWPRNSFAKRPGTIDIVIGPVIETAGRAARDILADAESWIEATTNSLPGIPTGAETGDIDERTQDNRTRPFTKDQSTTS
jgi:1-acyl-sn-glycerol-3-phosphate acyltransferase